MNARTLTGREWVCVALGLVLFSLCAFPWLSLPGPYQDELLPLLVVEPFSFATAPYSWEWGETQFPIMVMSYVGGVKAILLQMYFAVGAPSTVAVRCIGLSFGLLAIIVAAVFLRRHYSSTVAMAAVLLVATDASFIHTIRIDWGPVALMQLLKMVGLLLLSVWVSTGRWTWLAAGMFVFGVALWDKANFIWFLCALAVTVAVLFLRDVREHLTPRNAGVAVAAFVLGSFPLWAYNLAHEGVTASDTATLEYHPLKLVAAQGTLDGSAVLGLTTEGRLNAMPAEAESSPPVRVVRSLGVAKSNLTWPLMLCGLVALPWTLRTSQRAGILFALLISLLTYAVMFPLKGGGGGAHHVVMLYPFPILFAVASLGGLAERWNAGWLVLLVTTAALVVNLSLNARYLAAFAYTGGTGVFSDGIYRLVDRAAEEPGYEYHLFDWGMSTQFALLGHGRGVQFQDQQGIAIGYEPAEVQQQKIDEILEDPKARLIVHSEDETMFPRGRELVMTWVSEGRFQKIAEVHERSGTVLFEVYGARELLK